jgi:hypothetical protein
VAIEIPADCPDCGGELFEILLLDRVRGNAQVAGLDYTLPGSKQSFWTGKFPAAGRLASVMCGECGRVFFYGAPNEDQSNSGGDHGAKAERLS